MIPINKRKHDKFTPYTFSASLAAYLDELTEPMEFREPDDMTSQTFRTMVQVIQKKIGKKFGVRKIKNGYFVFRRDI